MTTFDIAVVGAGPAGLAAAARAAAGGRRVVLLDGGALPGGQYWRHRQHHPPHSPGYRKVAAALDRVEYLAGAAVWFAEPGFVLRTAGRVVRAERVVLATGAHDRVVPFPGWTLPGVTTAGGAQAMLKGNGVLVGRRVAVAGTGPFLLPVATTLARAGATVVGVFEANNPIGKTPARKVIEAAGYAATFARHRIPYRTRHTVVAAQGTDEVEAVSVAGPRGTRTIPCDALAVGFGFVPAIELGLLLGCATRMDTDTNLVLEVDGEQRTSVPGIYAAGEITGVGGVELAIVEGEIAGAHAAGASPDPELARRRRKLDRFAGTLKTRFPVPARWPDRLRDDTVICRCEEVPYAAVLHAVRELGATDARTVKSLSRTGMGWCQGRMCGYAVACLTATLCGRAVTTSDLSATAHRPLVAPITLGQLAGTPDLIE